MTENGADISKMVEPASMVVMMIMTALFGPARQ
jgi:hypothetical protein